MFRAWFCSLVFALSTASMAIAQGPPVAKPEPEHQWLQQFAGTWECTNNAPANGDQPAMQCQGTMKSAMVGELWVINEIQGDMGGAMMKGIQTIGYDPVKKKYVGTWIDSMMNHMWRYEGTVDESGKKLTLEAEGPNFLAPGKTALFRDAYEFKSPDHIVSTSSMKTEEGQWVTFMTGNCKKQK